MTDPAPPETPPETPPATSVLITGTAGFIGFHLANALLDRGMSVTGYDGLTDFGGRALKEARHARLAAREGYRGHVARLEDMESLAAAAEAAAPEVIVHLAAQAGVRYSIDNPRAYIDANLVGSFNVMEIARAHRVGHFLMASTSSAYGAATQMPFRETQPTDRPVSLYAATKKAAEAMTHAWAHIHRVPTTLFRFFTVYGPWGRPDMAPWLFTEAILEGRPINVYNHGDMRRDFTYVDDLVEAIARLIAVPPPLPGSENTPAPIPGDSLSPDAPWRVVNIGNGRPEALEDFIAAIEAATGRAAQRRYLGMQPGDVPATWADASLLEALVGARPQTDMATGIARFVDWYRAYHDG